MSNSSNSEIQAKYTLKIQELEKEIEILKKKSIEDANE